MIVSQWLLMKSSSRETLVVTECRFPARPGPTPVVNLSYNYQNKPSKPDLTMATLWLRENEDNFINPDWICYFTLTEATAELFALSGAGLVPLLRIDGAAREQLLEAAREATSPWVEVDLPQGTDPAVRQAFINTDKIPAISSGADGAGGRICFFSTLVNTGFVLLAKTTNPFAQQKLVALLKGQYS